ncbi:MAG: hypothetical protein AB7F41_15580 [Methylocystis sp.]|uniref:hypothetical protein n=1 Tax=Methylocystis sp. TaxID=1911079 RepID=UPI003D0BCE89
MTFNSALMALALAGALATPSVALGREFMDGAAGHCLLCDFLRESRRRDVDAECRRPAAGDVGGAERPSETGDVN